MLPQYVKKATVAIAVEDGIPIDQWNMIRKLKVLQKSQKFQRNNIAHLVPGVCPAELNTVGMSVDRPNPIIAAPQSAMHIPKTRGDNEGDTENIESPKLTSSPATIIIFFRPNLVLILSQLNRPIAIDP